MSKSVHQIINNYDLCAGGAQRLATRLHTALKRRGWQAHLLGLTGPQEPEIDDIISLGLSSPYRFRSLAGIHYYLVKNVKPGDIIHAHLFPTNFYLSLFKILGKVPGPLICTEHNTYNRRRGSVWGKMVDALTYLGYDQIIAISQGAKDKLLEWKPGLQNRTRTIYNGARLHFESVIRRAPKEELTIVSVGHLHRQKNYDTILEALSLLHDLDFHYRVAGDGPEADKLRKQRDDLGLTSKVELLGYVEDIPELLASADIFLMPSRWEGFGIAAVEAMNASLPLVASDIPGLGEIVDANPPCALLVDPESPDSIAKGLRKLLVSPELRHQLGRSAFRQSQQFSQRKMVEEYINLYDEYL